VSGLPVFAVTWRRSRFPGVVIGTISTSTSFNPAAIAPRQRRSPSFSMN
jgi:hypothetical protein